MLLSSAMWYALCILSKQTRSLTDSSSHVKLYGCCSLGGSFFGIWLKSEGYSVTQRNVIPSATWLISGFATVTWGFLSDYTGSRFAFVLVPLVSKYSSKEVQETNIWLSLSDI